MNSAATKSATTNSVAALLRYRTIDLVTIAVLGVAFGVVYWGWGKIWDSVTAVAIFSFPPSTGFVAAVWVIAGVVGGLVVRKPGAALATELVAAGVSLFILGGTQWGLSVLASGFWQGLGAEVIVALFLYRRWGVVVAALAGAAAGAFEAVYEWGAWYPDWSLGYKLAYLGFFAAGGAVIAGLGGWLLVRALARTGVLDAFGAGRDAVVEV